MIRDLDIHRFEYIWHLYNTNKSDKDLPFNEHKQCDPAVWQFPQDLIDYHHKIFEIGNKSLQGKTVLDLGCGTAWYLGCLENVVEKYIGIDADAKNIEYAKIMSNIVDVDSDIYSDKIENVKHKADTIMMLSVTHEMQLVENIFDDFDCDNIILDSWEKLNGVHLNELVKIIESKGFYIEQKHECFKPRDSLGNRYILHFHRPVC